MSMDDLNQLWGRLEKTPTRDDANGEQIIVEAFHNFPEGIAVEEIWMWFEEQNPAFSVAEQMGIA